MGSSSARAAPANQSADTPHRTRPAGKPRPHTLSGMGDTDTGHGHGTRTRHGPFIVSDG